MFTYSFFYYFLHFPSILKINHQYDKSRIFVDVANKFCKECLNLEVEIRSDLSDLWDLQVCCTIKSIFKITLFCCSDRLTLGRKNILLRATVDEVSRQVYVM
jgi:hypothetical protein